MNCVNLKGTTEKDYDEYYRIRSCASDIYWNGYLEKPNYVAFKELFLTRTISNPMVKENDANIYLVRLDDTNIGFVQFILRSEAIEIGYTMIDD